MPHTMYTGREKKDNCTAAVKLRWLCPSNNVASKPNRQRIKEKKRGKMTKERRHKLNTKERHKNHKKLQVFLLRDRRCIQSFVGLTA